MILLDTSGLLAWIDSGQRQHGRTVDAMAAARPPFLLSPFVLAEIDYLLATRVGPEAEQALLREVAAGAFRLEAFTAADIALALEIIERFGEQRIGLADASLVVLANRHSVAEILTLDERHFRVLRTAAGQPFRLVPADGAAGG